MEQLIRKQIFGVSCLKCTNDLPVSCPGAQRRLVVLLRRDKQILHSVMRSPKQNEEVRVAPFGKLLVAVGVGRASDPKIDMRSDQPAKGRRRSISRGRESGPVGF